MAGRSGARRLLVATHSPHPNLPAPLQHLHRMDWTDVYYRQLARLISRHTWLYTEMVVDQTLLHTPHLDKFLWWVPVVGASVGCDAG